MASPAVLTQPGAGALGVGDGLGWGVDGDGAGDGGCVGCGPLLSLPDPLPPEPPVVPAESAPGPPVVVTVPG
jgi:hypothetical protein